MGSVDPFLVFAGVGGFVGIAANEGARARAGNTERTVPLVSQIFFLLQRCSAAVKILALINPFSFRVFQITFGVLRILASEMTDLSNFPEKSIPISPQKSKNCV